MQIDEAFVDSQAANAAAIKNARGVVLKRKLVGLFRSADGSLLFGNCKGSGRDNYRPSADFADPAKPRSEEHTSELQSRQYLVCRLLLEKKKTYKSPDVT